jgi:hypothetical protein
MNTIRDATKMQLQRLAALPYNHYFYDEVLKARKNLGLPNKGMPWNKAVIWYFQEAQKYEPMIITLSIDLNELKQHIKRHAQWYDSNMPLEVTALQLVKMFQLPMRAIRNISHYIMTNNIGWIQSSIGVEVYVSEIYAPNELGLDCKLILDVRTTKKHWDDIWYSYVKPKLVGLEFLANKPQARRMTTDAYNEQMKRWSEWYKLVKFAGLTNEDAIHIWEIASPKSSCSYDASIVGKAVREFEKLIKPKSLER